MQGQGGNGGGERPDRFLGWLALAVLLAASLEFGALRLLAPLENRFGDLLVRLHVADNRPDPDIVIVDIDESSLERMAPIAGRYPWSRSVPAEMAEGLLARGARAVVFDILFTDPNLQQPDGDRYLEEVARGHPNLFFPVLRLSGGNDAQGLDLDRFGRQLGFTRTAGARPGTRVAMLLPLGPIAATGRLGTINFHEDDDGIGRRYDLYLAAGGWRIPSLPARLAEALHWPLPKGQSIRLNWRGPALSYRRISFYDLYQDLQRRKSQRPAAELKNKIVIIGATATGLHDLRATPVSSTQPAVEILATAIDNLKNGDPLHEVPASVPPLLTLLLIAGLLGAFRRWNNPLPIGLGLLAAVATLAGAAYAAVPFRYVLPVLLPSGFGGLYFGAAALRSYLRERRARERSVQIFSRFLDPRVVKDLVDRGESVLSLSGQSRTITVLFSDIRGFTTLSEQHTPEEIVSLLNNYFSRQLKVIFRNHGTMDKFIGDAIMAFWGAPVENPDQARDAVNAALEMCDALQRFKSDLGAAGENFDVGIGIHTGPGVVGFIGAENRLDYTAIGDTVNLASRIEGQTKGVARVLVSADTRNACGEAFDFIDHGFYKVKGRTREVQLFEPRRK